MAKVNFDNSDSITLEILQKYVAQMFEDSDINLVDPKLQLERRIEFVGNMIATLKAGVLADHVEHKEATYTVVELPRWLKWLRRFVVTHERVLKLDAYHTYPKANIKMPKLDKMFITITKQDYEL